MFPDPQQQRRAELFARLSSLASLSALKNWEALKLCEEIKELAFPWLDDPAAIVKQLEMLRRDLEMGPLPDKDKTRDQIATFQKNLPFEVLHETHKAARNLIVGLIEIGQVSSVMPDALRRTTLVLKEDGTIEEHPQTPDLRYTLVFDLMQLVRSTPFPFRQCTFCGEIFVWKGRQQYCSLSCSQKHRDTARKEERREYMRKYMEKKRQKAKQRPGSKAK